MENLMFGGIFTKAIKEISFLLDEMVYSLARLMFRIFCYISEATIVNDAMIEKVTRRIYVILGIGMTFIIAYYLLNYIVDPDKINDKASGAGTIIKDIIIALVIMTMTPTLFTKLYAFQHTVITSGVISKIFLGGSENYDASSTNPGLTAVQQGANEITVNVFSAFVMPKDEGWSSLDCVNVTNEDPQAMINYCNAYDKSLEDGKIAPFQKIIMDETHFRYWPLLSTVAGIGLAFFMLSFCINLAKRVGKMAVLQVLAPIPALLEIVPGTKGTRKTWIDMLVKTYLEVFVFQLVIFVIMFLITLVPDAVRALFENFDGVGILVRVFTLVLLIFGLLQFAKEAPKMVMDLLGIKGTGVISAALKRGVNMAGVTGGLLGSTVGRFAKNFNAPSNGDNFGKKLLSGFAGAGSGIAQTLWGARNVHSLKDAKQLRTNVNKQIVTNRVNRSAYAHAHGNTIGGVIKGHVLDTYNSAGRTARTFLGTTNEYEYKKRVDEINHEYKKLYDSEIASVWKSDSIWSQYDSLIKQAEAQGVTSGSFSVNGVSYDYATIKSYRDTRKANLVHDNGLKIMEGAGKLNNFIDTHQGIDGITIDRIDIGKAIDGSGNGRIAFVDGDLQDLVVDGRVIHEGYKPELDALKKDIPYQTQRVEEKVAADAKEATRKAAEQANKDKK